jgi:hypothetical protein
MNWTEKITPAGIELLAEMGHTSTHGLKYNDFNPITLALAQGDFLERYSHLKITRNRTQMSRLAVVL